MKENARAVPQHGGPLDRRGAGRSRACAKTGTIPRPGHAEVLVVPAAPAAAPVAAAAPPVVPAAVPVAAVAAVPVEVEPSPAALDAEAAAQAAAAAPPCAWS